jgi:hypothetical protein
MSANGRLCVAKRIHARLNAARKQLRTRGSSLPTRIFVISLSKRFA